MLKSRKFEFHLNRFNNRFRQLQPSSMVSSDSQLNDEANKRSLASNGLLGAEKSQKEKLYVCCPFSHNCKCWLNISRLLAECWPIASRIGVDVFIKNAKSKSSNLAFLGILMGKVPPQGFWGRGIRIWHYFFILRYPWAGILYFFEKLKNFLKNFKIKKKFVKIKKNPKCENLFLKYILGYCKYYKINLWV